MQFEIPTAADLNETIVAGGDTANILYGKLQRAAQLPTTRLNPNPIAAVTDKSALSGMLWSSFAMSNVPSGRWMDADQLAVNGRCPAAFRGALFFADRTTNEPKKGGFQMPSFFGGPVEPSDPLAVLEAAGTELVHAFLICDASAVSDYLRLL